MADDVELGNPCKKARLDEDANDSVDADQAKLESSHYSSFTLGEVDLNNQRNGNLNENFKIFYVSVVVTSLEILMSYVPCRYFKYSGHFHALA